MSETGGYDAQALHGFAHDSIARGSKSFAFASRLFDRLTRERVWLLYAWCRAADDLTDGQDHGGAMRAKGSGGHDARAALARIHALTDRAFAGEPTGDPAFDALGLLLTEVAIPRRVIDDIIAGFELDADDWRPRSEADLLRYCYHVAGAVGVAMALVMGVDPADETTLDRASDLGIAFQLANIARDLGEDAQAGRCYLPADWLMEAGIAPDTVTADPEKLAVLAARLCALAETYAASGRHGTPALGFRSAWAVLAAAGIYGDIAREVAARGAAAWDRRVSTSAAAKLGWILRAFGQARLRVRLYPPQPRAENLWTRPR